MKRDVFFRVKQHVSCDKFKEQATQTPYIRKTCCSNFLSSIILICILTLSNRKFKHFRRFNCFRSSISQKEFVFLTRIHVTFSKVSNCYCEFIRFYILCAIMIVSLFVIISLPVTWSIRSFFIVFKVDQYIVTFNIIMCYIMRLNNLGTFKNFSVDRQVET